MRSASTSQRPTARRLLAIGDIHGCLGHLRGLLEQVAPSVADSLVFLGDYIDRGEDSPGVVDCLLDLRSRLPQTVFLKGNHEQMLLNHLAVGLDPGYLLNGGDRTLDQYERRGAPRLPDEHRDFLNALALLHEEDDFIFAHAGLRPGRAVDQQTENDLLWVRDAFLNHADPCEWGRTVVHGHTPQRDVSFTPCRIGLDTGAVYGRRLSCCDVLTGRVWQFP